MFERNAETAGASPAESPRAADATKVSVVTLGFSPRFGNVCSAAPRPGIFDRFEMSVEATRLPACAMKLARNACSVSVFVSASLFSN